MKSRIALFALLSFATQNAIAQIDKPRLRQLANMPSVHAVITGFRLSQSKGVLFGGEETESPLLEIARIRKEMKGDASDAERYLRLGVLYAKTKREKDSAEADKQAVALFRQQVNQHPHDMLRLAQLGDALCRCGETKEGEVLLRQATKEAPNEWRAWVLLGNCIDNHAYRTIWGDEHFYFYFPDPYEMNPPVFDHKPTEEQIAEMRQLRKESRSCFDRAIELAPQELEAYSWRAGSLMIYGALEGGLRNLQGERVRPMEALFPPDSIADARQVARLSPNDPQAVGGAVVLELMVYLLSENNTPNDQRSLAAKPLPESSRDFLRWGMGRLQQLTKSADRKTAAAASEILAHVVMTKYMADAQPMARFFEDCNNHPALQDKSAKSTLSTIKEGLGMFSMCLGGMSCMHQMEQNLRRTVQLDPSREHAWDLLIQELSDTFRAGEAVVVCEQRIKSKDNAHNRFLLANAFVLQEKYDKAAEQLWAGIKEDENDLDCRLGLLAVLLRQEDAEALKRAGEQLGVLQSRVKKAKSKARSTHFLLLRGLHAALSDQPDRAKELFRQTLRENINEGAAVSALAALGEPATPEDEALAVAYLRAHKVEIQRRDKQPASSVVLVRWAENTIEDDDLFFLTAFPQLRDVRPSGASITDAGLKHLFKLKGLKHVDLRATAVSEKGVAELRKVFPKLDISR